MRVAVVGASGQLGTDVARSFAWRGDDVFPLTHADIEVSDVDSVAGCLRDLRPDVVVNTAAMHHVEKCEQDPDRAHAVNVAGPGNLAQVAQELECVLAHISTDYVFDGCKGSPYVEDDAPRPLNVYGRTKLAGEEAVRVAAKRHFVLRTSALYGHNPCRAKGGQNFIQLMLRLARERGEVRVVANEVVSPTSSVELADQIAALSRTDCYGLYHATAEGSCSWFEFARAIFSLTDTRVNLMVAGPAEFSNKTPRPAYSVLENQALKRQGLNRFGSWQDGLEKYLLEVTAATA